MRTREHYLGVVNTRWSLALWLWSYGTLVTLFSVLKPTPPQWYDTTTLLPRSNACWSHSWPVGGCCNSNFHLSRSSPLNPQIFIISPWHLHSSMHVKQMEDDFSVLATRGLIALCFSNFNKCFFSTSISKLATHKAWSITKKMQKERNSDYTNNRKLLVPLLNIFRK